MMDLAAGSARERPKLSKIPHSDHRYLLRGRPLHLLSALLLAWLVLLGLPAAGHAGVIPELEGRLIRQVNVEGLRQVPLQLVLNNIRTQSGAGYRADVVRQDIVRLTELNRFSRVDARVIRHDDGDVTVNFVVDELPLLTGVQVVGNKTINDRQVLAAALVRAGDPADPFLIRRSITEIERLFRGRGFEFVSVDFDPEILAEDGVLLFRVREGPRVRLRAIRFEGNDQVDRDLIQREIESRTALDVLLTIRRGHLDSEMVARDVGSIRAFYRQRGYLEAEVGSRIEISPNQEDAVVTFIISEGQQFTVNQIDFRGNEVFSNQQLRVGMELKPGDVFSTTAQNRARDAILAMYHKLGHVRAEVVVEFVFVADQPKVNVLVRIDEGRSYQAGAITIRGNRRTRSDVAFHQVRGIEPGRTFDGTGIEATRRQFTRSRLFGEPQITLIDHPTEPDVLDVLIEVREQQTGSFAFGAAASTDLGIVGNITLTQRNFDIEDFPESFDAFFSGQSFIGAGQFFRINVSPGSQYSSYTVDWAEPNFLSSDFSLSLGAGFVQRDQGDFDEDRINFRAAVGRAFGDVWSASVRGRVERVYIRNDRPFSATDIFDVRGESILLGLGFGVVRSQLDNPVMPSSGNRLAFEVETVGLGIADFNYTQVSATYTHYWTLDTDFLNRKTILRFRTQVGYSIPEGNAPIFERYFAGGQQTFRGFRFRGVGPRGERQDNGEPTRDSVGGDFLFLSGLELTYPIYDNVLRGALFVDTGTVQRSFGFDEYRVSVGFGLRVIIPFIIEAPIAVDIGFPLIKQEGDQTQAFSINAVFPF